VKTGDHFDCTWSHWKILWHTSKLGCTVTTNETLKSSQESWEMADKEHCSFQFRRTHKCKHTYVLLDTAVSNCWGRQEALINTLAPLPHPFDAGARLQLSPGAVRGGATPWQTLPHSFFSPSPSFPPAPQTPARARGSCRPPAIPAQPKSVIRLLPLARFGQFRKSSSLVRFVRLTNVSSYTAVIQPLARGPYIFPGLSVAANASP
jgi:hypothetical protein